MSVNRSKKAYTTVTIYTNKNTEKCGEQIGEQNRGEQITVLLYIYMYVILSITHMSKNVKIMHQHGQI